ncbi:hypothetical protein BGZ46_007808 [Entomortierella lignicola]|nr:hypothetical protein BGZ46_007808 [Entomortierella lignicola]
MSFNYNNINTNSSGNSYYNSFQQPQSYNNNHTQQQSYNNNTQQQSDYNDYYNDFYADTKEEYIQPHSHSQSPVPSERNLIPLDSNISTSRNNLVMNNQQQQSYPHQYNQYGYHNQQYPMQEMTQQHDAYEVPFHDKSALVDNYHSNQNDNNYDSNTVDNKQSHQYYNGFEQDPPPPLPQKAKSIHSTTSNPKDVQSIKVQREKSKYLPCFPCIRSTWGRFTCCFCIFILLVIIVIVILVFTIFKVPSVQYLDAATEPSFSFHQGNATLAMNMVANIQVKNPNPIGFNFDSVVVTAYYPNYTPSIGGGTVNHVSFPSKSTTIIKFPLSMSYDSADDPGYTVVQSLLKACGILGGSSSGDITINYDAKATMKIIGISFSYTLKNQSYDINCPADIGQIADGVPAAIISGIGGIISDIKDI